MDSEEDGVEKATIHQVIDHLATRLLRTDRLAFLHLLECLFDLQ